MSPRRVHGGRRCWRPAALSALAVVLVFAPAGARAAVDALPQTTVSIEGDRFLINGSVTYRGTAAEGLLLNSRMVQGAFDDENVATVVNWAYPDTGQWDPERNTTEFVAALPSYAAKGLRAITINMQGGGPRHNQFSSAQEWIVTAFNPDGSLKQAWLARLERVIRAADENGIVVIVGYFYFGQDQRLASESAVITATDNATDWLLAQRYTNVLVEITNESGPGYEHEILQPARVGELIDRVRTRSQGTLKVSTSFAGGVVPSDAIVDGSDFVLLHGNGQSAPGVASMIDEVRTKLVWQASPKPIVFNEDSTSIANLDAAVSKKASWGYYDQGQNNYWDGFQSPPVNWAINTPQKVALFDRVAALTHVAAPPPDSAVRSFTLIDADSDQPISELCDGNIVNLAMLPTRNLNIRADTAPATVGSVRFELDGNARFRVEDHPPYALAGDLFGDYFPWTPSLGPHVATATPHDGPGAGGRAGTPLTVSFSVVDAVAPSAVTSFTLIDADSDQPISELCDGDVVNLATLPTRNLSIRANTAPATVGSVRFELDGDPSFRVENTAPYALAANDGVDYFPWEPPLGPHVITATPYQGSGASGEAGSGLTASFVVLDESPVPR